MKRKLALIFLTCAAGSAFAQDGSPNCVVTNFDQGKDMFTIMGAAPNAVNQQCFLTVHPAGSVPADRSARHFVEGRYEIVLSGGGGGGGGGSAEHGGGGGGAGALPARTVQYLNPGVYRLTIGRGGQGGHACLTASNGGRAGDGNPTSISEAYSGTTIAGFSRAEYWAGRPAEPFATVASRRDVVGLANPEDDGSGGTGVGGQSDGGNGGHILRGRDIMASDGTMLKGVSWGGMPGKGGDKFVGERPRHMAFAGGGGGGAGYGNGGDGHSLSTRTVAKAGELGGGGGGGAGGAGTCAEGARGGDGFIKMSLVAAAPQAAAPAAPAPAVVVPSQSVTPTQAAPAQEVRPIRRDRN